MPDGNGQVKPGPLPAHPMQTAIGNMMPNDGNVDLAPEERGMQSIARREPTGDMHPARCK